MTGTDNHAHKHRRTTSEIPVPPPTHRRTHGEAATEALSCPPFCLKICIRLNAPTERGACAEWGPWRSGLHSQHRRSEGRHAQCPPPADDRHHEEWTNQDAESCSKCCITECLQSFGRGVGQQHDLNTYFMACFVFSAAELDA